MRYKLIYLAISTLAISLAYSAAPVPIATSYSAFTNWVPVIFAASLLAVLLAGVYYLIGYLLNNNRIRASAISELEQAGGSVLLVVLIIGVLYLVGTSTSVSFTGILGNHVSDFSNICNNYLSGAQVSMLNSNKFDNGLPEPTTAVCQNLIGAGGPKVGAADQITTNIDFGLAATYVVIANMTNESIGELNSLYNFESLIFFLRNLNPFIGECFPATCVDPLAPTVENLQLMYKPYGGYVLHRTIMPMIVTQAILSNYMMILELIIVLMLLLFWPYLLGAGILLRTVPFTRRAGGLIIAATVVGVLILPTLFLIEYSALSNLHNQPFIGSSQIPGMALCGFGATGQSNGANILYCYTSATQLKTSYIYKGVQPSGFKPTMNACLSMPTSSMGNPFNKQPPCYVMMNLSLYAFPNAANLISFYSCYPNGSSILPTEMTILTATLVSNALLPVTALLSLFVNNFSIGSNGLIDFFFSGPTGNVTCISQVAPHNIVAAITSLINMYGIIAVAGFILPILNALIMLSAMTGLSSLIGGETTIIGLSRFL